MRFLVVLTCLMFSLSHQVMGEDHSWVDSLKGFFRPVTSLIFEDQKTSIELPDIPSVAKQDRLSMGYEQRQKNKVTFANKDSKKYNYSFVKELFRAIRQKEITEPELYKWLNVLSQSGSREGIYRALVLDQNYLSLENYDFNASEAAVDFSLAYMNTYLAQDFEKDRLMQLNFYTLKRNIVEKTLEVVDVLFKRPNDDLYHWYAVFSSDLAKRFPKLWVNEVRRKSQRLDHKMWALQVPDQYIKSEVIIKLHTVFNYLQKS